MAATKDDRVDACYRAATAAVTITERIEALLDLRRLRDTRLCGVCGCMCKSAEACPACRFRLIGRRS